MKEYVMNPEKNPPRKPYQAPSIQVLGTLADLTLGSTNPVLDVGLTGSL